MIRRLRRCRPLVVVSLALLIFGVCVPVVAAHFTAVLSVVWGGIVPAAQPAAQPNPERADEQTAALLSLILSRAPPQAV